ncbi:MAG: D-2-hydroxyacid dehydrogenase [Rhizobiales bacterium]|nr:D-2-hydroxyacid dehydrogenase [Hyphomicrobiales bacterium]
MEILRQRHPEVSVSSCSTYAGLADALKAFGADIVYSVRFAGTPGFPRSALIEDGNVRWIAVGGSGTDHLVPWDPARVTVTNSAGVAAEMMSQYAIGAMLHFALDVPGLERDRRARRWQSRKMMSLDGKTLLVIGLGQTGRAIARRAKSFGLNVLGVRANPRATPFVDEVLGTGDLHVLLPRADIVAVCLPLLATTRGSIGELAFHAMKLGAILIDLSRGGVVNQAALIRALEGRRLSGAALDVFETEPLPAENPLWQFENVLISPHCSSVYDGWELNSMRMFCDNLERWRQGKPLFNIVDPARGY